MLFICLAHMPYGYYQLVRFVGFAVFLTLALLVFERGRHPEVFIFVLLALLFQPFIKVVLGRTIWNVVDVVVAAGLLISLFVGGPKPKDVKM